MSAILVSGILLVPVLFGVGLAMFGAAEESLS